MPRLLEMLERHQAGATFFFSLGPDHTGALRRLVPAIPAPDIGRRCPDVLRAVRDAGFEIGILAWDSAAWQAGIGKGDADWTARQMALAMARYEEIFGERATVRAAPAWKMNKHAWRNTQALGFDYAADTCGTHPFVPVMRAEIVACPQVPTTLPTMDDWIGREGVTEANVVDRLLQLTAASHVHVYTLRAGSEGRRRAPLFERLLEGWKAQGYELATLRDVLAHAATDKLPMHTVLDGNVPDRRSPVALQGPEFLPEIAPATA